MISVCYFCDGADGGCRIIFVLQYLTRRCGRIRTHCGLTVIFSDARTVACQSIARVGRSRRPWRGKITTLRPTGRSLSLFPSHHDPLSRKRANCIRHDKQWAAAAQQKLAGSTARSAMTEAAPRARITRSVARASRTTPLFDPPPAAPAPLPDAKRRLVRKREQPGPRATPVLSRRRSRPRSRPSCAGVRVWARSRPRVEVAGSLLGCPTTAPRNRARHSAAPD
jgi:hypothetical protein